MRYTSTRRHGEALTWNDTGYGPRVISRWALKAGDNDGADQRMKPGALSEQVCVAILPVIRHENCPGAQCRCRSLTSKLYALSLPIRDTGLRGDQFVYYSIGPAGYRQTHPHACVLARGGGASMLQKHLPRLSRSRMCVETRAARGLYSIV